MSLDKPICRSADLRANWRIRSSSKESSIFTEMEARAVNRPSREAEGSRWAVTVAKGEE